MTHRILISLILTLTLTPLRAANLRVGASAVNLEADDTMILGGSILPKYAKGQEGELRCVATVLEKTGQPGNKVAIVACDVLFMKRDLLDAALARIETTTGIPPSHVLVNATHTHHAPATGTVHGYARDETFCARVIDGIVRSVKEADARLASAGEQATCDLLFHRGEETTVGANSRLLLPGGLISWSGPKDDATRATGPFDPDLPVLAFRGPRGSLRALLYGHSTHTIGTRLGAVRSPSFYGLAAQELEVDLEIEGAVTFLEGASGSTHNVARIPVKTAVLRMKDAVRTSLENARVHPVDRLLSLKRPFTFKVRSFDEESEDAKVVTYCEQRIPQAAGSTVEVFRDMRRVLAPQQGQPRETWLQVILIGEVAIAAVPAEYFTALGLDIKKRSPFPDTFIAELANDWIGYLPDREAHRLGGYQTWTGLHSYAEPGTGERIADEIVNVLREIKGK